MIGVLAWVALGLSAVTSMALSLYIDFRVRALIDLGGLPASTPRPFSGRAILFGAEIGLDIPTVFSRELREVDDHTRRLVPVIRSALLMLPVALVAVFVTL